MTAGSIVARSVGSLVCAAIATATMSGAADAARPQVTSHALVEDASGSAPTPITPPKVRIYCVVETRTGSRMPKRTCLTAEEWKAKGLDVPAGR